MSRDLTANKRSLVDSHPSLLVATANDCDLMPEDLTVNKRSVEHSRPSFLLAFRTQKTTKPTIL